jgi:type IV secretory pathway VirB2 component (pilin)
MVLLKAILNKWKKNWRIKMNKTILMVFLLLSMPLIYAVDFGAEVSNEDKATFDQILEPVMKIYNFVKYTATVLAVIYLVFAGVTFIMSGNDIAKRESAKMMATYIVVGLIVIWVAPFVVNYLVG